MESPTTLLGVWATGFWGRSDLAVSLEAPDPAPGVWSYGHCCGRSRPLGMRLQG